MAPRRKSRGWLTTNRQAVNDHHYPTNPLEKLEANDRQRGETNIEEWVYRFLGNLAAIENNRREPAKNTFANSGRRQAARRRFRSPTPYSWDRVEPRSPVAALQHPADSDVSAAEDNDAPRNVGRSRSRALSPNPICDALPQKDHLLLQRINRYIRSGIAEGKRRAKRYVQKALSFALEMGYLVQADRRGKLLRVSPALANATKPSAKAAKPRKTAATAGKVRRRSGKGKPRKKTTKWKDGKPLGREDVKPPPVKPPESARLSAAEVRRNQSCERPTRRASRSVGRQGLEKSSGAMKRRASRSPSRPARFENLAITDRAMTPRAQSVEVDQKPLLPIRNVRSASTSRRGREKIENQQ